MSESIRAAARGSRPDEWLGAPKEHEELLSPRQRLVLRGMREWIAGLRPARLFPEETWANYDAHHAEMYLVLPLHAGKGASFQLCVTDDGVAGDWQNSRYAWDFPGDPPSFVLEWTGQDDEVVERVLTLTEEQLRRPLRRGWVLIKHVDGQPGWATKGTRRGGKPAGYFDPP